MGIQINTSDGPLDLTVIGPTGLQGPAGPVGPAGIGADSGVVSLATTFSSCAQEGGATVMQGTFVPLGTSVVLSVDISGLSASWGGTGFFFAIGVVPVAPPASPEGGSKPTRITDCATNASRTPLVGITEYAFRVLGQISPQALLGNLTRKMVFTGLTPGRVYDWEIRAGGYSYFKEHVFPTGWLPTYIAHMPGDETYAMVGCAGTTEATRRVSMVQLGWSPLWNLTGDSIDMLRVADFPVSANVVAVAMQSGASSRYCLAMHATSVTVLDTWTKTVGAVISIGHGTQSIVADRLGLYFYVGCQNGHVHRFNIATQAFDLQLNLPGGGDYAVVFGTDASDAHLWVTSYLLRKLHKIDLLAGTVPVGIDTPANQGVLSYLSVGDVTEDGRVVAMDPTSADLYFLTSVGVLYGLLDIDGGGVGGNPSVSIAPRDERVMFVRGSHLGWVWLDTAKKINQSSFGLTGPFGQIINTDHEATMVGIPAMNKVIQWPGGDMTIDPSLTDPTSYGAMHADVFIAGGSISGG